MNMDKRKKLLVLVSFLFGLVTGDAALAREETDRVRLPAPVVDGKISVEKALAGRRSVRDFGIESLNMSDVSQVLWSAQGITHPNGYRTAPSAGALYPLEIYLVAGNVSGLPPGVYQYCPTQHELLLLRKGDLRASLSEAAFGQTWIQPAPALAVIAGIYDRTARKYGDMAARYVHMEVGHVVQNIYLQCTAQDLATVFVGAFDDKQVRKVLGLPADHAPLGIMPFERQR